MKARWVVLILCLALTACQNTHDKRPATTFFTSQAMCVPYKIIVGEALSTEQKKEVQKIIDATFGEVNQIFNDWNPHSEISQFNKHKANDPFPLSSKLENFLLQTQQYVTLSGGRFDPTVHPLVLLWKDHLQQGTMPSQEEIAALAPAIGWDKITLTNGTATKTHDNTALNLGGVAKGHCVDLLVENLNAAGYPNIYVEWGGEIRTAGHHPQQRPWAVFVSYLGDPDPNHAIAKIDLHDNAIATSGDYNQKWMIDTSQERMTFTHIIDPRTLRPLTIKPQSIASTTVVAPSCALADALATAAMMFESADESQAWAKEIQEKMPGTAFWIITRE